MKRTLIVLMILTAALIPLALAGAQDDTEGGTTIEVSGAPIDVLPLERVTESAAETLDITSTTARVNFIGTEALACYLIYGTDTDFGNVTNDPQMASAAIVEHNPIMTGLEPDTEYVYRLLGTSENGQLYVSEVYSFRTRPADESGTDNLLAAANGAELIEVSSIFGDGPVDGRWGVLNAFDDNPATEWATNGDGDDAFFEVDLGGEYAVNEVTFSSRSMTDGTAIIESFTLQADGDEVYGPFEVASPNETQTYAVDFTASTLRFNVAESTGGNVGAVDIGVYGEPVE